MKISQKTQSTLIALILVIVMIASILTACAKPTSSTDGTTADGGTNGTSETTADPTGSNTGSSDTAPTPTEPTPTEPTQAPPASDTTDPPTSPENPMDYLSVSNGEYVISSRDKNVALTVFTDADNLSYKVSRGGELWIKSSALGLEVNNASLGKESSSIVTDSKVSLIRRTYPLIGNQSSADDICTEVTLTCQKGDTTFYIDLRVYDDGVALRYRLTGAAGTNRTINDEYTTFDLGRDISGIWYGADSECYESRITYHEGAGSRAEKTKINAPITVVRDGGGYIAIMESGINPSYPGTNLTSMGSGVYKVCNTWDKNVSKKNYAAKGDVTTGWRLINFADTLNGLVNNYNVYSVARDPDASLFADADWIVPGRATWSWLVSYAGGLSTKDEQIEFIKAASKLGFEYNIVDDGWPVWSNYEEQLTFLGMFGEEMNVKQLLWSAITSGTTNINKIDTEAKAQAFFDMLKRAHFYGSKVDFWWNEDERRTFTLQEQILVMAAKYEMLINFHGAANPGGVNITYPNEITREGIYGMEQFGGEKNNNYSGQAGVLVPQLFTRYLNGHGDWTPSTYTAMQIGTLICTDSPMMAIATDPREILKSPAVEFIKAIPTAWDRTVVLKNSDIGKRALYAKEKSGVWYLGGIYSAAANSETSVKLSEFLQSDGKYLVELWDDGKDGVMTKYTYVLSSADTLKISAKAAGGGFAARFTKLALSQYGGEITAPITITTAEGSGTVKYTTDGSNPVTGATAKIYSAPITLTATCTLRAAIVDGVGKGTEVTATFNLYKLNLPSASFKYEYQKTTVTLSNDAEGSFYYTTNGAAPTTASAKYTAPIVLTAKTTLKVLFVPTDTKLSQKTMEVSVTVQTINSPTPDIFLDDKPISSHTDWDKVYFDISMNHTTISLGGTSVSDGQKFEKGISANANAYFEYRIPTGAKRFVGAVGIDDSVWANTIDSNKASAKLIIKVDGATVYTSNTFKKGQYYLVDITLPTTVNASSIIRIEFNDAGDGITCDNVSLANAGFIK